MYSQHSNKEPTELKSEYCNYPKFVRSFGHYRHFFNNYLQLYNNKKC